MIYFFRSSCKLHPIGKALMKQPVHLWIFALVAFLFSTHPGSAADTITLQIKPATTQWEVGLRSQMALPVSAMYSEYSIQWSTNMVNWQSATAPANGGVGVSDETLRILVPPPGSGHAFYRVVANVKLATAGSRLGEAVYGYSTEFARQLQLTGQLPLSELANLYPLTNAYLPQITFDPATAEFWDQFNLDPAVHNATNSTQTRLTDFRLNTNELAIFQTNGFVVSARLGDDSFADSFYKIFTDDLPVFVSCDAVLHAWHRSYVSMLEEIEEIFLAPTLETILQNMAAQVPSVWSQVSETTQRNAVKDADYFLAVARSLITGTDNFGSLGQNSLISSTLAAINNLQPGYVSAFGTFRSVDFSQFQVRGHYETSQRLQRYFRAMMWCGLMDFRFAGATSDNSTRELAGAAAMHVLMNNSGQLNNWKFLNEVIQMFVGLPDSLNFAQLNDLMATAGIQSAASLPGTSGLQSLQSQIMAGQLGVQNIQSGYFWSPLSRQQIKLPRSFTVQGQRFVMDAWAMGQCVFDKIIWDEDGIPGVEDKVLRRVPSALDVAFTVLGNNQVVPEIASRIAATNGHPWRDGRPYQHNLAAVRRVIDLQNSSVWTNNIYNCWLGCLRELSPPTTGPEFPDAMRTRAWAMKTLNTQLASWTQLRHDTVLYAKQPYTGILACSYPDGFIEPRVSFWERMRDMALRTMDMVANLPDTGDFVFESNASFDSAFTYSIGTIFSNRLTFLDNFAAQMTTLRDISIKELNRQPLTTNETFFLQTVIEGYSAAYTGVRTYSGWYPTLFYRNARTRQSSVFLDQSDLEDALVTDVHTDTPDDIVGDPGAILHEGVGRIHLLIMAVNLGLNDVAVYAGPVMSHYEFELGPTTRKSDSQWKSEVNARNLPPQPDWTRGYLVP
ncbi:MAG: DUF3160 domain-containing protein [Verrucomicrobia bacterium]|nr:DUF3160 domain-containing protein [Verrucomicrobiota bacterium]